MTKTTISRSTMKTTTTSSASLEDSAEKRTAAVLVIGNEVLSGKVREQNVAVLAERLFAIGVELRRVIVCPDEMDVIVSDLNTLRAGHDLVFTSGGVGPTHDDITMDAVAQAFDQPLVELEEVARMLRSRYGDDITDAHLRMANAPRGARLLRSGKLIWPTVVMDNVYVLPGVPAIFEMKLDVILEELDRGARFQSRGLYTWCDEGEIAEALTEVAMAFPDVLIGSYVSWPRDDDADHSVKLTFDSRDDARAIEARDAMALRIPAGKLVRAS